MSVLRRVLVVGVVVVAMVVAATGSWAARPPQTIRGGMSGAHEVPGPGDPDGSGSYKITFTPIASNMTRICNSLRVSNIATPNAAHIHTGARGVSGPVFVPLATTLQSDGTFGGCVDRPNAEAAAILANPRAYYVNVHNVPFPNGALRGQLHHASHS